MNSCRGFVKKKKTLKNKCLDVDSIFSEWMQETWLMFEKEDLIKVHLLNMEVVCICFEAEILLLQITHSEDGVAVLRWTFLSPSDPGRKLES